MKPFEKARKYLTQIPPATEGKNGDNFTYSIICILINDLELSPDQTLELLLEYNERCKPPWEVKDLRQKIKNVTLYSSNKFKRDKTVVFEEDFHWDPPTEMCQLTSGADYPIEALPKPLAQAVGEVSRFAKVPPAGPAMAGLASLAIAIGKKAMIAEKISLEHFPTLFFSAIAPSGQRKTDQLKLMTSPLVNWQEEQYDKHKLISKAIHGTNKIIENQIKKLEKKMVTINDDAKFEELQKEIQALAQKTEPIPPTPRLFTSDVTEQRLFQLMHERDGQFAIVSGEGRPVYDFILGKYSGDGHTGESLILSGISGDTITRDRVGGAAGSEERVIHHPMLNVMIFVQPDKHFELATNKTLRESGALARMQPVVLPVVMGSRIEEPDELPFSEELLRPYSDAIHSILSSQSSHCHKARLTKEARELRRKVHNDLERKQMPGEEYSDTRDIASKMTTTICKIALILHILKVPSLLKKEESEIDGSIFQRAVELGLFHLDEAVRIQRQADGEQTFFEAQPLLQWLAEKNYKSFRIPDIQRLCPRPRTAKELEQRCAALKREGWLKISNESKGGKPTYLVHPEIARYAKIATPQGGTK